MEQINNIPEIEQTNEQTNEPIIKPAEEKPCMRKKLKAQRDACRFYGSLRDGVECEECLKMD